MTRDEMLVFVNNPNKSIEYVLNKVYEGTKKNIEITDPTNPFTMLLEASAISASNAVLEPISLIRKMYPDLAETKEELNPHITDNEIDNIYSQPATGSFIFYINLLDFKNLAVNKEYYLEAVIPKETSLTVANINFTILNDIIIKLYPDDNVFVEQITDNDNELSIDNLGIISSGIISDKLGSKWIIFETLIKQLTVTSTTKQVISAESFNISLPLTNKYVYSTCEYMNSYTNNNYIPLKKQLTDTYYNPNKPTIVINVNDENVKYNIPDIYLLNNTVSGTVKIKQYETLGKTYIPLDQYPSTEFKLMFPSVTKTNEEAVIKNITIQVQSRLPLEGGSNGLTFEELKDSVINNSKAYQNMPISRNNLKEEANKFGFDIFKSLDTLTDRIYFGSKVLPTIDSDLILADPDIYFNKVKLILGDTVNNKNILLTEDFTIIKSGTIFKEINNEVIIVNDEELDYINKMDNILKSEYMNKYKYFRTPYYYIIKNDATIKNKTIVKTYNLDTPMMSNFKILAKNNNVSIRVNTDEYGITKKGDMFIIKTTLKHNENFKNLSPSTIKAQLSIPIEGDNNSVDFITTYDPNDNSFTFGIISDLYINDNNNIKILNGNASLTNKFIKLLSNSKLYIYTTDTTVYDNTRYLVNNIKDENTSNITVLNLESIDINFGYELKYLWKNIYNDYTERKYKTYDVDVYDRYENDVYKILNDKGETIIVDDDGNVQYEILHHKGDIIYNNDNNPIISHHKGDIIVDENNLPIIDKYYGVVKYLDIIMIDYNFYLSNNNVYQNYILLLLQTINRWLTLDIKLINDKLLENTTLYFKTYNSINNVKLLLNNKIYINKYYSKPEITLYTNLTKLSTPIYLLRKTIGNIIREELLKSEFNIDNIKNKILETYKTEVVGCNITNITDSNIERFKIEDLTKRLTLNKKLTVNSSNELMVEYDIDIKIFNI